MRGKQHLRPADKPSLHRWWLSDGRHDTVLQVQRSGQSIFRLPISERYLSTEQVCSKISLCEVCSKEYQLCKDKVAATCNVQPLTQRQLF